jgi:hypothetical protein
MCGSFFELLGPEACQRLRAAVMDMNAAYAEEVRMHCPNAEVVDLVGPAELRAQSLRLGLCCGGCIAGTSLLVPRTFQLGLDRYAQSCHFAGGVGGWGADRRDRLGGHVF